MNDPVELAPGGTVFRLIKRVHRFIPEGAHYPNGEAFEPSSEDKRTAELEGQAVRVSVWDASRTTIVQAAAIRQSDVPLLAFALAVDDVAAVRERLHHARLRVVEDPQRDLANVPGGVGHCGIEGLDHRKGEDRRTYKTLRDELAQRCRRIEDEALAG